MYRDDICPMCGESLPPDHLYCREHAAEVDERLHEIGTLLARLREDVPRLATLIGQIAPETWDWLAEAAGDDDNVWPPAPRVIVAVHADEVDVDVDTAPGRVRIDLSTDLRTILEAVGAGLAEPDVGAAAEACGSAEGAGATH